MDYIFSFWHGAMNKNKNTTLTKQRRKKIEARLKNYPVHEICIAIDNATRSDWHMATGEHSGKKKYNDLVTILRDDTQVETFRDM